MKIVDRTTFLSMPSGTMFSKYQPCIFEPPAIKRQSIDNDFFYSSVINNVDARSSDDEMHILYSAERTGESFNLHFETIARDGCFESEQLFAIWEEADIKGLVKALEREYVN